MAEFFKNLFKSFTTFDDDEEDTAEATDEYDSYVNEELERQEKKGRIRAVKSEEYEDDSDDTYTSKNSVGTISERRASRFSGRKVVPIKAKDLGLSILRPTDFNECDEICNKLSNGEAVILNLSELEPRAEQRIIDFVAGAVYMINGDMRAISGAQSIYIVSPGNIDISGDYDDIIADGTIEPINLIK